MKRSTHLVLVAALVLAGWTLAPASASAERVKTTRKTRVYARPGESARIIKRLPSGRSVTVLARKGRWIKVRVGSEIGYLTRTSVISSQTARNARANAGSRSRRPSFVEGRSRQTRAAPEDRRGASVVDDGFEVIGEGDGEVMDDFGPEASDLDDVEGGNRDLTGEDFGDDGFVEPEERERVVAMIDSAAYKQPNSQSGSVFGVGRGNSYSLIEKTPSGKWMLVEDGRGDRGWVRADQVEIYDDSYQYEKTGYYAGVGMAYSSLSQQFRSDGAGQLANYDIDSAAFTVGLQGDFAYKLSERILLGANLGAGYTRSSPGIQFVDEGGNVAEIPFSVIELHPTARVGFNFKHRMGLALYGRAGFLYSRYDVDNATDLQQNVLRLPSEILSGVTAGVMVDAPRITDKIRASLVVDVLALGARAQTAGLEDGQQSAAGALWANLQVEYKLLSLFDVYASIRYLNASTEFAGMAVTSERGHNATRAERRDGFTTLGVGLIRSF